MHQLPIGTMLGQIWLFQGVQGTVLYFYYGMLLALLTAFFVALGVRPICTSAQKIHKRHLAVLLAVVLAFVAAELLFVHPAQQVYNDEYIYMSIAKTMIHNRVAGICSFSNQTTCVAGTQGLFQQPTGWPLMLAAAFTAFGIGFGTAFNTVLALSALSIALVFFIAFMLFEDPGLSVLASISFAATPLFLTYARSAVVDVPTNFMFLLSIALVLAYLKCRKFAVGMAAISAMAYTSIMKVDGALVIPIALVIVLAYRKKSHGRNPYADTIRLLVLVSILALLMVPEFVFVYQTYAQNAFGQAPGQPKFSVQYLVQNAGQNMLFWLGAYGSVSNGAGYYYHVEYPLLYSLFALAGAYYLARERSYAALSALAAWFIIIFVPHTAYYAGGVLYNLGIDARYYLPCFAAVSILAAAGISSVSGRAAALGAKKDRKKQDGRRMAAAMAILAAAMLVGPLLDFNGIVTLPPSQNIVFAAERASESMILGNYSLVPHQCAVASFKPTLWYILNYSNIYAAWLLNPEYYGMVRNMSGGCIYLDYDISCTLSPPPNPGYDNTTASCSKLLHNFTISPVVVQNYTKFGWNSSLGIYRITGTANASRAA